MLKVAIRLSPLEEETDNFPSRKKLSAVPFKGAADLYLKDKVDKIELMFHPKKQLGQNFLKNSDIAKKIATAATLDLYLKKWYNYKLLKN